uniref:Transmembrane protein n=1 Tax=Rheinheimera sp. BAL341 TaxID=1708203 RepID=A0A486XK77_9GAMM
MQKFSSFNEFYPYYLAEHRHPVCRALHYIGSMLVLCLLAYSLLSQQWHWLWLLPLVGYGFAWLGHFLFEHNRPATFKYPLYSLAADWVMLKDFLTGQINTKLPH